MWEKCLKSTSRLLSLNEDRYELAYRCAGKDAIPDEDSENDGSEAVNDNQEASSDSDSSESDDDDDSEPNESEIKGKRTSSESKPKMIMSKKVTPSIVDDQFFKLSEMEAFLDSEDKKEMLKTNGKPDPNVDSEDDIDYFNDDLSEDTEEEEEQEGEEESRCDARNMKFSDFFDADDDEEERRARWHEQRHERHKLKAKRNKADLGFDDSDLDDVDDEELEQLGEEEENIDDEEGSDSSDRHIKFNLSKNEYRSDSGSDNEEDDGSGDDEKDDSKTEGEKSSFELRQQRLKNRIAEMENEALGEKSWQLKGEVDSTSRPKNSLLENVLEFDSTTRPAPLITEETTQRLEDIIKQRIKDKAWDDVERKVKPINEPQEFRKSLVLDQEKSKESLAQIYEKDYLKTVEKLNPNKDITEQVEEPPEHKKIRAEMKSLFVKLDALSNFFYTPKPVAPDAKIITNTPAINMEEVAPVGVSDATLLAPEEVKSRPKGDVIGKSERDRTDKNRERRQKKQKQKQIRIATEERALEKEKLGIKSNTKEEQKRLLDKVSKNRNVLKVIHLTMSLQGSLSSLLHSNSIFICSHSSRKK